MVAIVKYVELDCSTATFAYCFDGTEACDRTDKSDEADRIFRSIAGGRADIGTSGVRCDGRDCRADDFILSDARRGSADETCTSGGSYLIVSDAEGRTRCRRAKTAAQAQDRCEAGGAVSVVAGCDLIGTRRDTIARCISAQYGWRGATRCSCRGGSEAGGIGDRWRRWPVLFQFLREWNVCARGEPADDGFA